MGQQDLHYNKPYNCQQFHIMQNQGLIDSLQGEEGMQLHTRAEFKHELKIEGTHVDVTQTYAHAGTKYM